MTLSNKLKLVRDALTALNIPVYHYEGIQNPGNRFIVWQEISEDGSFHADNDKHEQMIYGTIDLFTKTEFDTIIDSIQAALDSAMRVSYRLNRVLYEDETGLIHYEWEFWVV